MGSLPLDFFNPPLLGRAAFEQRVIDKSPFVVNDDVVGYRSLTCFRDFPSKLIKG
jgi:hypothetical protein